MTQGRRTGAGVAGKAMTAAALDLLEVLPEELRRAACGSFDDDVKRRDWAYVPGERAGVSLGELDRNARKAVHRLVASGVQPHAYAQVATIMALEDVLDHREGGHRERHSTDYWTMIFGDPAGGGPWGWRFEGHHASLNLTLDGDRVLSATPCFLGANPAAVSHGTAIVLRPLAQEEELARALLEAMPPRDLEEAVVAPRAPSDIRKRSTPDVGAGIEPLGVSAARLDRAASEALRVLVGLYLDRAPDVLAHRRAGLLEGDDFHQLAFAWEGSPDRGRPHYYRIQGPGLLIEYDNSQNDANHIHSVWRDPGADFGGDILARHYARHHPAARPNLAAG